MLDLFRLFGDFYAMTYIGKEDAGNTASRVKTLSVALGRVVATGKASLVASHRVLVRLDATVRVHGASHFLPAYREEGRGYNLDKVHKVKVGVVGELLGVVQGIAVVVSPGRRTLAQLLDHSLGQLGAEAQVVDVVRKVVLLVTRHLPVVLEVMHVHVAVAETAAGSQMKVAHDLVHLQETVDAAALVPLLFQTLRVVLALALLKGLAVSKGPGHLCICLAHLLARVAAAGLLDIAWGWRAAAVAAVAGVQVLSSIVVQVQRADVNDAAAFAFGTEAHLVYAVGDAVLLLARHVHDIEGQELAGHTWECDVEVNIHALACSTTHVSRVIG